MDDTTLWIRWTERRDGEAFAEIVSRHASMVFAVARRVLASASDAEDVAQECFLELVRSRPTVRSSLAALLHSLALSRSLDRLKSEARRRWREKRASDRRAAEARAGGPESPVEVTELLANVDAAIASLPEKLRLPLILRFLEGRSAADAAASLGIPESTLRLRLDRGIGKVRAALARRGISAPAAVLAAALAREAVVAAPHRLLAALGKVALSGGASIHAATVAPALAGAVRGGVATLAGALLMKKKIAILAALLFALGGAAVHFTNRRQAVEEKPALDAAVVPPPRSTETPPVAAAAPAPARDEAPAAPAGEPAGSWIDVECLANGDPAAGAEVFVVELASHAAGGDVTSISHGPQTTGPDGRARFAGLPSRPGVWLVQAFARIRGRLAGIASVSLQQQDDEEGAPATIAVSLLPASALHGIVKVPEGGNAAAVRVRVTAITAQVDDRRIGESLDVSAVGPLGASLQAMAGPGGEFTFEDIPSLSTVRLQADAPGLARATVAARPPWDDEGVVIRMTHEGIIEGTLTFADTGAAAAGIRLVSEALPVGGAGDDALFDATAGAAGAFRFSGLPAGAYTITLPAAAEPRDWKLRVAGPFAVAAGAAASGIELVLERAAAVAGQVRDRETGLPVPDISIAAIGPAASGRRPLGGAVSDASGRYSFALPPGESTLYVASHVPGYEYPANQGKRPVTIAPGEELGGVDFELQPRAVPEPEIELGRAAGRVLDPNGRPLEQVPVRTFTLHDPARPQLVFYSRTAWTDAEGRFSTPVPAGPRVHLEAGGRRHSVARAEPFTVEAEARHTVPDLTVRAAHASLEGRVVGTRGEPIEGAQVWVSSPGKPHHDEPARTDESGRFRVDYLLGDEMLEIEVRKEGHTTLRREDLRALPGEVRLVLEKSSPGGSAGGH